MRHAFWILPAALMVFAPGAAAARVRDDVMSGAFRCAAIGPSRVWLDCFYGAAQPARTQLGLSPAPEQQVRLAVSPPRGDAVQDAGLRDAVLAEAFRCPPGDDRQWLNCYYAAAQPLRARLGLVPAPQSGHVARAAPMPVVSARPAILPQAPRHVSERDHVRVKLATYVFDRHGMFTITLPDGEMFQQRSDDANYAHWRGAPSDHVVSVTMGIGAARLEDERDHTVYTVQKIR